MATKVIGLDLGTTNFLCRRKEGGAISSAKARPRTGITAIALPPRASRKLSRRSEEAAMGSKEPSAFYRAFQLHEGLQIIVSTAARSRAR